ncbi:MAG: sporulation protein YtxC [Clostridia bacterium]|nr:sporulation protein YtxC [Clostridia bacterium]
MWEFSVGMDSDKVEMAKYIYNNLKERVEEVSGIITSYEQTGKILIVIACENCEKNRLCYHISDVLTYSICTFVKEEFLDKNLKLPIKPELELYTFKKALVSFDRETDRFLINRQLILEDSLYIEPFFYFKLQSVKEKWQELLKIANDNSTYLLSNDAFLELLKFLIDNIEISFDEVNVVFKDEQIIILGNDFEALPNSNSESLDECGLVSKLLELSPRKINWYSKTRHDFLEKIFEKRILLMQDSSFKNMLDKTLKMI